MSYSISISWDIIRHILLYGYKDEQNSFWAKHYVPGAEGIADAKIQSAGGQYDWDAEPHFSGIVDAEAKERKTENSICLHDTQIYGCRSSTAGNASAGTDHGTDAEQMLLTAIG